MAGDSILPLFGVLGVYVERGVGFRKPYNGNIRVSFISRTPGSPTSGAVGHASPSFPLDVIVNLLYAFQMVSAVSQF